MDGNKPEKGGSEIKIQILQIVVKAKRRTPVASSSTTPMATSSSSTPSSESRPSFPDTSWSMSQHPSFILNSSQSHSSSSHRTRHSYQSLNTSSLRRMLVNHHRSGTTTADLPRPTSPSDDLNDCLVVDRKAPVDLEASIEGRHIYGAQKRSLSRGKSNQTLRVRFYSTLHRDMSDSGINKG